MKRTTIRVAHGVRRFRPRPPVLTANITNMCLEWTYDGPPCDYFAIYEAGADWANDPDDTWRTAHSDERSFLTDFDDPPDAAGMRWFIVPMWDHAHINFVPVTAPSNIAQFA